MTCSVCRHGFCWVCMGDWATHDGSYYTCNKFKADEESTDVQSVKFELDRYAWLMFEPVYSLAVYLMSMCFYGRN